jgi:hypothetical protein
MAQTLKGYTSRDVNRLLRRTGEPLWQAEWYDHRVRDGKELERIGDNIDNKPREPGLVARPADYPDRRRVEGTRAWFQVAGRGRGRGARLNTVACTAAPLKRVQTVLGPSPSAFEIIEQVLKIGVGESTRMPPQQQEYQHARDRYVRPNGERPTRHLSMKSELRAQSKVKLWQRLMAKQPSTR